MNKNNIFTEAVYGFKSACRNILFQILVVLAIVGIVIWQFIPLSGGIDNLFSFSLDWISQALPSSIAYKTAYFFNIVQLFLVVGFVSNDLRAVRLNAMEPLRVRPLNNEEIVLGNFLGKLWLFTLVNFLVFAISIFINFAFFPRSFDLSVYLFYWVTLNLPTLVFSLGVSYLVTRFVRQQALSMLILFSVLGTLVYWGAGWLGGLLDPCARNIPNMFSDLMGHVGVGSYLLQRGFIFLLGGGCLVLSVIPYPRIPNYLYVFKRNFGIACVIFIVAGSLAFVYIYRYGKGESNREVYKRVYVEYERSPAARVVRNDLHVKDLGRDGISVTSQMTLTNKAATAIPLVIYLNPSLKVTSLEVNSTPVDFKRESQAILVDENINPGDTVEVSMRYEGGIDNDICFLDVAPEKYHPMAVNDFGIYRFGYAPAFCEKGYKLLTPECVWYPVGVPPYNASGVRDVNFTRYSLRVEYDPRLNAISQGNTIEERNGETIFTFHHDMPGISLCLGNYKKREITIDSTRMTLYCLSGHDYLLGDYADIPREDLVEQLTYSRTNTFEMEAIRTREFRRKRFSPNYVHDPTQQYPYHWFTVVEVPCSFYSFPRIMQLTGERVQGGMVFFPEKGFFMKGFPWERSVPSEEERIENTVSADLDNRIKDVMYGGVCDVMPQVIGKSSFIFSQECPIIHEILGQIARGRFFVMVEALADGSNAAYPAVKYLSCHSLKDALSDRTLSSEILGSIMDRKSKELYTTIQMKVGEEQFRQFYVDFLKKHLFEEVVAEELFQQFYQTFGFSLDSLVSGWYTANRLPLFEIRDARVIKVKRADDSVYGLYKFKVFNRSDVPGVIMTDEKNRWIIPPREGREICVRSKKNMVYATRDFYLDMPLAMNLPGITVLKIVEMEEGNVDTTTGVFDVDSSFLSLSNKNEIIVDNEDPGFRVVKAKDNFITSLFRKDKSDEKYYKFFREIDAWCPTIGERFYGFPIQSALYKTPGTGKQKVEWNVVLPQEGKYEVFFYYTELFEGGYGQNTAGKIRYYTVSDGENEYDVTITPSEHEQATWVSLGVFDFSKEAKVTLSDRTIDDGTPSAIGVGFVADAVKWVRVE